ncbi:uncharacterized protein K452DRAFT_284462 [Aplosporella prunicola CBS 121167]|uniref:Uncharacterized protein n=1 Tax=Aplosporella prunicola CBS 121167 TaxID=1176127 RepID=A0A6A6BQJ5_9PEZI|nr:uncharacterized protein K452DRAFT_284462 [Aplosporella prunicola CBS 121167]KAF2145077.1 hypothetical protein K452DRAFT_284462 [Aplosporella prunicola CBS 121167]
MDISGKACVLMLNLPPSALGGINLLSFTTTDRFKGIKELPQGWHFVFTSSTSSLSVRHGAWFHVQGEPSGPPELFIKKWEPAAEEFVQETNEAEILKWRGNLSSIWREGLTPYRQSASKDKDEIQEEMHDWVALTDSITSAMLTRITGSAPDHWSLTSASSAARDMDDIPGISAEQSAFQPEKELRFLPIDLKQTWREGATGRERTHAAQDRTWALGDLIERHCADGDADEILGELQFCFLMVLTLNNNSCLEQWKRLLSLLLTCKKAVVQRPELYTKFLGLLRLQLQHCQDAEGGLFDLSDEGGTLLGSLLRRFKKGLEEVEGLGKEDVVDELEELEDHLRSEYGWQFDNSFVRHGMLELEDGERVEMDVAGYEEDDESGEYAPMVVELTPEQAKSLGRTDGGTLQQHPKDEETTEIEEEEDDLEDMDARY